MGRYIHKTLSQALAAYSKAELRRTIGEEPEILRVTAGIALLIEFEGDMKLADVDSDVLLHFRDGPLQTFPEHENRVRMKFGTTSMKESIEAVRGMSWKVMSPDERDLRLKWIGRMFRWLTDQKWIQDNPATVYARSRTLTKLEREAEAKAKDKRLPFAPEDLTNIFSAPWYTTGKGLLDGRGNVARSFQPFQYWMPLPGLLCGCRIGEVSQLWLRDIRKSPAGNWYLHVNEDSADKDIKTTWSERAVPLHPILVQAGFVSWCDRLRQEGFHRVFPELSWNPRIEYSKEPVRAHSELFKRLGMPRNNTKVFHSFRRNLNTELEKTPGVTEVARRRILGHLPGEGVGERHYLADRSADEAIEFMAKLDFRLPPIAKFDEEFGILAVRAALQRKKGGRLGREDVGPSDAPD